MGYFRSAIDAMTGYVPGEQPAPGTKIIKLNTNENPYPPSPQVANALQTLNIDELRRYPDPSATMFRQAVSDALQVPADWVIVGNGSDDILNLLVRACAESRDRQVVYPTPTYVLYKTLSAMQTADVVEIPYAQNFQLPLDALIAANGAITFVASPNSPSGHIVPLDDLRTLAKNVSGIVVIDEAYVDFAEFSALPLVHEFENVVVLRTLSKGYALAGLRMGFGIANPKLLAGLFKVKDSYNVDAIAIALGTAAMRDQTYKNARAEQVKASREKLSSDLKHLGFSVLKSQGNFVLATPGSKPAEFLYLALKERGILVRYFNQPGLADKLRISIGTEAENSILIEVLASLLNG
ncbi:histidinol phosphate aminotransferase apoenzyme [Leptolyngbya sp. Heron Island J]|uniref:histidinol-phosphate transaminase n=1 Tax=Leptolyngbya sp. Heron Island J TaxID=1385935 RepID=UPI0003B991DE|nr:histidinol-phosphate transaminase [Leptolyngbya sp. Heron Island J]ESA37005.1 histidinol phosphate aminotransferase apoenzyme [Leptolyngbya sp. Heron Island J]